MSDETKCMMCGLPIGDWDFVQHDLHADHRNCDLVVAAALAQRDEALAKARKLVDMAQAFFDDSQQSPSRESLLMVIAAFLAADLKEGA